LKAFWRFAVSLPFPPRTYEKTDDALIIGMAFAPASSVTIATSEGRGQPVARFRATGCTMMKGGNEQWHKAFAVL
jgi:hypothetical protein